MRRNLLHLVANGKRPPSQELHAHNLTPMRRQIADAHGPKVAAWLVRMHRKSLHALGWFKCHLPMKLNKVAAEKSRWFFIAVDHLVTRDGWSVSLTTEKGQRVWKFRWTSHGYWARKATTLALVPKP